MRCPVSTSNPMVTYSTSIGRIINPILMIDTNLGASGGG